MNKFKGWLMKYYDQLSNIISSVLSIVLSLLAEHFYSKLTQESEPTDRDVYVIVTLGIFLLMIIILTSLLSKVLKNYIFKDSKYDACIQKAYFAIQQLSLECQESLQETCDGKIDNQKLLTWILNSMQLTVEKCYNFFCTSFDSGGSLIEEIKFEVTFMTLSYKDSKITIPCSCNKERRTPTSMLMRINGQNDIYDNTVTAEIYNEYKQNCKPSFKVIEDTSQNYRFIYNNQSDRIKSSIVLPVLSHKSELLGTLVVHCNSSGFFKENKKDFWYEIMQLFASEIGKYKLMLDYIVKDGDVPF